MAPSSLGVTLGLRMSSAARSTGSSGWLRRIAFAIRADPGWLDCASPRRPRESGTQEPTHVACPWIPACAGMTVNDSARWGHSLVAQQFVDRGLGARLLVDALDDDGAIEAGARAAVGQGFAGLAPRHQHRIGRHAAPM